MNELYAIIDAWRSLDAGNSNAVLATVVHVTGSAYRRPGARMLILPDGRRVGCVSGGCLEGEISTRAWWFTESGTPALRVYNTTSDDDAVWEFGLGCNGVVHVLLERVNTPRAAEMLEFLEAHRVVSEPAVVATIVRTNERGVQTGDRLLVDALSGRGGVLMGTPLGRDILQHACAVLREKKSRLVHLRETDIFVEWIGPPQSLVVFGAGHDAIPLVNLAAQLGWRVTVADGRSDYARRERFPQAEHVVIMRACDLLRDVVIDRDAAVVMMTHSFPLDVRLLPQVLARQPRYIGLLGPRSRAEKLFHEAGVPIPESVHAPAGLDIGCDNSFSIALSITAEIQAVTNSRTGSMLMFRDGPIHLPAAEVGVEATRSIAAARPLYCETSAGTRA